MNLREKIPTMMYRTGITGMIAGATLMATGAVTGRSSNEPIFPPILEKPGELRSEIYSLVEDSINHQELPNTLRKINENMLETTTLETSQIYIETKLNFEQEIKNYDSSRNRSTKLLFGGITLCLLSAYTLGVNIGEHRRYERTKKVVGDSKNLSKQGLEGLVKSDELKLTPEECGEQQVPYWFAKTLFRNLGKQAEEI